MDAVLLLLYSIGMIRKNQEARTMDMDTLGYFIYMDEMEKQQQPQEDSDDSSDDESN